MKEKSIKILEQLITDLGLEIEQKKESDNIYLIMVPYNDEGNFVIYTTRKMVEHENESCFRMYQLKERIPFSEVTIDSIRDFIWKYESICLENDLPIPSFDENSEEIFVYVYSDMIKKSNKCLNKYHKMFFGISAKEIENRILTVI